MLRFFKSGLPSRFFVLLLIFFVLRLPGLLHTPPPLQLSHNGFLPWFFSLMPVTFALQWIIAFMLLAFAGLLVNYLGTGYGFTGKSSSMAVLFFVLLNGSLPLTNPLNPFLLAAMFLIWSFSLIFRIPDADNPIRYAFDAGLTLGIAALFYPPLLLMVAFIWVALLLYQMAQWRTYFVAVLGIIIPYLILYTVYFIWPHPMHLLPLLIPDFKNLLNFSHWHPVQLIATLFFVTMIVYASAQALTFARTKNIDVRQHTSVTFWAWVFLFALMILFRAPADAFLLLSIPSTWLLASYFESVEKIKRAGWFVTALFVLLFIHQLYFFIHAA